MNKHFTFRIALMIALLCGVSARGWADGETVIFSEDFNNLSRVVGGIEDITSYNDWELTNCASLYRSVNGNIEGYSLKIGTADKTGKATTKTITGITNSVNLQFSYSRGASSGASTISVKTSTGVFEKNSLDTIHVIADKKNYKTDTYKIINAGSQGTISFSKISGVAFALATVNLTTPVDITLSDATSNVSTLEANANKLANVTIGRTFSADTWCTLCLPFDVTTALVKAACGQTADPKMQVFDKVEGSRMEFVATDAVAAGTPFLLKLAAEVTTNPTFSGVTVSSTAAQSVGNGSYSFIGTYSPVDIPETGWFLKADGKLYKPGAEKVGDPVNLTLKGLRAYFTFPTTLARPVVSIANDDGSTTDIAPTAMNVAPSTEAVYSIDGRLVASPKSGNIYIVRQADGTIRKVTIR